MIHKNLSHRPPLAYRLACAFLLRLCDFLLVLRKNYVKLYIFGTFFVKKGVNPKSLVAALLELELELEQELKT